MVTVTLMLKEKGFEPNGEFQVIDGLAIYPMDVFCPLNNNTGRLTKTEDTAAIHWFGKSWLSPYIRHRSKITRIFHRFFGEDCFEWLKK